MNIEIPANYLANRFTKRLRKCIGAKEMKIVAERNKSETNPFICHSHDFCDANQVMIDAWNELWPEIEIDPCTEEHTDLINKAWEIAKKSWNVVNCIVIPITDEKYAGVCDSCLVGNHKDCQLTNVGIYAKCQCKQHMI